MVTLDAVSVKHMLASLERKINRNLEMRMKFPGEPAKCVFCACAPMRASDCARLECVCVRARVSVCLSVCACVPVCVRAWARQVRGLGG